MNQDEQMSALRGLLDGEHDRVAALANAGAFLYEALPDVNWVGFYLAKHGELVLGPFQGRVACARIAFDRGVCGAAYTQNRVFRVQDVHAFPGHIACDAASRSEIVLPLCGVDGAPFGVMDLDSPLPARFTAADESFLREAAQAVETAFIKGED